MQRPLAMDPLRHRLFLGLLPDAAIRAQVAARARAVLGASSARVYDEADLHLTLVFLGDVPAERGTRVAAALEDAFATAAPVVLRIGGTGVFATGDRERALWAGFDLDEVARSRLLDLVVRGRELAVESGIGLPQSDLDRPFVPHLTLARPRASELAPESFARLRFDLDWRAESVHLFESAGSGASSGRYPVRASVRLRGV